MSRIFKRPMFRKGGEVMEGIMTGIKPRENYLTGGDVTEQYDKIYSGMSPSKDEILTKLLISGGLRGMSQTGGGGTLGNLAKAFQEPTEQALSESFAGKRAGQQAKLKGLEFDIKKDLALKNLQKKLFESGTQPSREGGRLDRLAKSPGYDEDQEINDIIRVRQEETLQTQGKFGSYVGTGPVTATGELAEDIIESDPVRYPPGTIIYDPYIKRMKIVDDSQNLIDYELGAIKEG